MNERLRVSKHFKVRRKSRRFGSNYCIVNNDCNYLHADGSIVHKCSERWPLRELAQAVLDKFQKPEQTGEKKMRKLTLDETWDYTKRMWKWIAFQREVLEDGRDVYTLKVAWLKENAPEFVEMEDKCFFCHVTIGCGGCPGRVVDSSFNCNTYKSPHHFYDHPGAFYREILRLDAVRTAVPAEPVVPVEPEHEWVHGDVFETKTGGTVMVHLIINGTQPVVYVLDYPGPGEGSVDYCLKDATFLFNIKDKL